MVQLILDTQEGNVYLPESRKGGYTARKLPLSVDVEMVTGRLVRELRGEVWVVTYQYGYLDDTTKAAVLAACEKGKRTPITCGFLEPGSAEALTYRDFLVTNMTYPKFMWSRRVPSGEEFTPVPMWADFSLELREVKPA